MYDFTFQRPSSLADATRAAQAGGAKLLAGGQTLLASMKLRLANQETLVDLGAYGGESSHGATKSIYAHDPDGNEFEVMWMLPKASWGDYENAAPIERLDLAGEAARWGGVRTASELVPLQ